jgi:putative nucleotidyltransferase with HDIG domain
MKFPLQGKLYVSIVAVAGGLAIASSIYDLWVHPISTQWVLLAAITVFSGAFTVRVPSLPVAISVSEAFLFLCVMLFGTSAGTIAVALDGLIVSLWIWIVRRKQNTYQLFFNTTEPAVSVWVASTLFFWLANTPPLFLGPATLTTLIWPLAGLASVYFLLNSGMNAIAVSLETGQAAFDIWSKHFLWLSVNYFGGASVALLLVLNNAEVGLGSLGLILPLLVISYLTFKMAMARVEDTNAHLSELNKVYLSTVETLAMAIDAKDQITHGHIRRVQRYAVALAKLLGVSDESLLKAIEAAALLHDTGKLAIPENILNKPGRLTGSEFEKMKMHVTVGADILSGIEFPYPVVPIVRHHHENWDGSGYPDGLTGPDIPIGARILAVVDCFDALTSDRPYRPRLSDQEALQILLQRRGSMYDPLVVDAFSQLYPRLGDVLLDGASKSPSAGFQHVTVSGFGNLAHSDPHVAGRPEETSFNALPQRAQNGSSAHLWKPRPAKSSR